MGLSLPLHVVILAAGRGVRMRSSLPKPLHRLAGKTLLDWVISTARQLDPQKIHLIYRCEDEALHQACDAPDIHWVYQREALGTGHALAQALPHLPDEARILVLSGDTPLISINTLKTLLDTSPDSLSLLTTIADDPTGLGRILRNAEQEIMGIIEEKDADPETRAIREIYTGICVSLASHFKRWLPQIKTNNAQKEYYLTDIVRLAREEQTPIEAYITPDSKEVQGINSRAQLADLERYVQRQQANVLLEQGASLADPQRIDIRGNLTVQPDVYIDINTLFEGEVSLGESCYIGPHCVLKNVTIGDHSHILAHTMIEGAIIGAHCTVGPFARLRPGTQLHDHCKIGNFVETKNAQLDTHSKANHLTYLGDVRIGKEVNIGAGTITCNYDGALKHQTLIEDGAFIGSGTELVAPITIGAHATIGAGTTLRENAPPNALTLTIGTPKSIPNWRRPTKKEE